MGDRVQYKNAKTIGKKLEPNFWPRKTFVTIAAINEKNNTCHLRTQKGKLLRYRAGNAVRSYHFDFIRPFRPTVVSEAEEVVSEEEEVEVEPNVQPRRSGTKRKRGSVDALCSDVSSFHPSWWG